MARQRAAGKTEGTPGAIPKLELDLGVKIDQLYILQENCLSDRGVHQEDRGVQRLFSENEGSPLGFSRPLQAGYALSLTVSSVMTPH